MKFIKEKNHRIVTFLSFAAIPLTGLATDVYLPSLPSMTNSFHESSTALQATLLIFVVSTGLTQLVIGSFLDSFGRYRFGIAGLIVFSLASLLIALAHNILIVYILRAVQGVAVAIIIVAKRAYFIDTYTGEKLEGYISLFSVVWATAPIVAPFIGGYLQDIYGWQANFYFLGIYTSLILFGDLIFGGESLRHKQLFNLKSIMSVCGSILKTKDYTLGLLLISISYGMLLVFGICSPFIIENVFHRSAVVTGYSALLSGTALMTGGIISRSLISKPLNTKVVTVIILQILIVAGMIAVSRLSKQGIYSMMAFVMLLHITSGFLFNNLFAYCLSRFKSHGGVVSGLTGGSLFVITSVLAYSLISILSVKSQLSLSFSYLTFLILNIIVFFFFQKVEPLGSAIQYPTRIKKPRSVDRAS